jgi:hypothetical protein
MPPRGYRDETKALQRSIKESRRETKKSLRKINKLLAENPALSGGPEALAEYQRLLGDEARELEHEAQSKAAFGREPDLRYLIKIPILQDRDGISPHSAAGKIADEIGGDARLRHANRKRLYGKFQKAPALYRRLAWASEDPSDAAEREIAEWLGLPARADRERQRKALQEKHAALYWAAVMPQLLEQAHRALEEDELARVLYNARDFESMDDFALAYRAVRDALERAQK